MPRRGGPDARDYVIAGIVRGAKPAPEKEKMAKVEAIERSQSAGFQSR